jgi:hypothetical protein
MRHHRTNIAFLYTLSGLMCQTLLYCFTSSPENTFLLYLAFCQTTPEIVFMKNFLVDMHEIFNM